MEAFAAVSVGVEFFDVDVLNIKADASIELPYLGLEVQPIPNGDANCNPVGDQSQSVQQLLGNGFNAIKFTPTVEVVTAVDVGSDQLVGLNQSLPLPTACFAFDKTRGSVVPASEAVAAAASSSGAAAGLAAFRGGDLSLWSWQLLVVLLATLGGGALVL